MDGHLCGIEALPRPVFAYAVRQCAALVVAHQTRRSAA